MNHRHGGFALNSGQQGPYIQNTNRFDYQSHHQRTQPYGATSEPRPPPPQILARPQFTQRCPTIRQHYAPPPPPPGVGQPCLQERPSHRSSLASARPLPLRPPGNGFWLPPPQNTNDFRQGQMTEDGEPNTCPKPREAGDLPKTSASMSDHSEKENSATPVVLDLDKSTSTLPSELEKLLKSLMQPLFCKLCNAFLNAPNQAQQHYSGKSHAKKVRLFIKDAEAKNTELPKSKLADSGTEVSSKTLEIDDESLANQTSTSEEMKPLLTDTNSKDCGSSGSKQKVTAEEYCGLCDASFNSPKQAEQHYQGKNHAKKLRLSATANIPLSCDSSIAAGEGSKFTCFVCNVHVTSQGQLTSHLNGSRHKTKLRIQQRGTQSLRGRWCSNKQEARCSTGTGGGGGTVAGDGNGLPPGLRYDTPRAEYQQGAADSNSWYQPSPAKKSRRDFSNYRTPSGKYYCSTCNVMLNAEGQFAQHIDSKRHKSSCSLQRSYLDSADFT